jgi:outer membrane lipoprotein carrier protein
MDGLGSVVQLSLTQIQLNIALPAGSFTFTPPAGAEVLRLK